jgi:hypothetical protein
MNIEVGTILKLGGQQYKLVEFLFDRFARKKWEIIVRLDAGSDKTAPHGRKLVDMPFPEFVKFAGEKGLRIVKSPKRRLRPKQYD